MPSQKRVDELIAYACQGKFMEAVEEFYAEDASVQENAGPPRMGRAALREFEEQIAASVAKVHEIKAVSYIIQGDQVAINWVFDYVRTDGQHVFMDEIAYQTWKGEMIVRERFYYDTATLSA